MHRLPVQAEADHFHSLFDYSHYLGPGHFHHVSIWSDAPSDQGTKHPGAPGLRQQNQPLLLVQGELAQPGDEEDLHHRPVCKYLPCPSFTHCDHVCPDWYHTFQDNCSNRRKARQRQPPHCVKEEAKGD